MTKINHNQKLITNLKMISINIRDYISQKEK